MTRRRASRCPYPHALARSLHWRWWRQCRGGLGAPKPTGAIGLDRENHQVAHSHAGPISIRRNTSRDRNAGTLFGARVIPTPEPEAAVSLLANVLDQIGLDLCPVGRGPDAHWRAAEVGRAIAELAGPIVSPGPQRAIPFESDAVWAGSGYLHPIIPRNRMTRRGLFQELSAFAQLTVSVLSPGPDRTIRFECQGGRTADSDVHPVAVRANAPQERLSPDIAAQAQHLPTEHSCFTPSPDTAVGCQNDTMAKAKGHPRRDISAGQIPSSFLILFGKWF